MSSQSEKSNEEFPEPSPKKGISLFLLILHKGK